MQILSYSGSGERIDTRLAGQFNYSRNFFHHIIQRDGILVNSRSIKKSYKLKDGDQIVIDDLSRYLSPLILDESPPIQIPVVFEKQDYLIINKPKGVLSHPNSIWEVSHPSVVGFLYHNYKDLPTIGNFIRAGLIHRLDKDTDGLMIIAKTEKGLTHFKSLFQQKSLSDSIQDKEAAQLKKFYRATCYLTDQGKAFISDIKSQLPYYIQEMVVPKIPHYIPKLGITKIISFDHGDILTMKQCNIIIEILTGRTHQIRYHLSIHGLPIVGDYLYGTQEDIPMQLTAYKLQFIDPDGDNQTIEI